MTEPSKPFEDARPDRIWPPVAARMLEKYFVRFGAHGVTADELTDLAHTAAVLGE